MKIFGLFRKGAPYRRTLIPRILKIPPYEHAPVLIRLYIEVLQIPFLYKVGILALKEDSPDAGDTLHIVQGFVANELKKMNGKVMKGCFLC
jgi:hypothetical protein